VGPFYLLSIIYANIQKLLFNFVAALTLISFMPSFITIRLNLAQKTNQV